MFKVIPQVATLGAESAECDCLVVKDTYIAQVRRGHTCAKCIAQMRPINLQHTYSLRCVFRSLCVLNTTVSPVKTTKQIEMQFWRETLVG